MPSNREGSNANLASNTIINNIASNNANNSNSSNSAQPQNIINRATVSESAANIGNLESNNNGNAQLRLSSERNILSMSLGLQDRTESTNTIGSNRFEDKGVQTDQTKTRRSKRQRLIEREYVNLVICQ